MRPKRMRKLLLHRRQIHKLMGAVERDGNDAWCRLKLYFNDKGPRQGRASRWPAARSSTTSGDREEGSWTVSAAAVAAKGIRQ